MPLPPPSAIATRPSGPDNLPLVWTSVTERDFIYIGDELTAKIFHDRIVPEAVKGISSSNQPSKYFRFSRIRRESQRHQQKFPGAARTIAIVTLFFCIGILKFLKS